LKVPVKELIKDEGQYGSAGNGARSITADDDVVDGGVGGSRLDGGSVAVGVDE
jgi:hypothetical protein